MLNLNAKLREQHLSSLPSTSNTSPPETSSHQQQLGLSFKKFGSKNASSGAGHGTQSPSRIPRDNTNRISIRDKLLLQEVNELTHKLLPPSCSVHFPSPSELWNFVLTIKPDAGSKYSGGCFKFRISVPLEYNNVPPEVKCLTRIWHPNISEDGNVCLSVLRQTSLDGFGWSPTRRLKDVVWGLNSLFGDLLDFEDPLNIEAAEHYHKDPNDFEKKVRNYIRNYCDSTS